MSVDSLEKEYTISISYNGNYYMVYNFFGKLRFTATTLEEIEKEMKRIYKILKWFLVMD